MIDLKNMPAAEVARRRARAYDGRTEVARVANAKAGGHDPACPYRHSPEGVCDCGRNDSDEGRIVKRDNEAAPIFAGSLGECQQYVQDQPQAERGRYLITRPAHP